MKDPLALFDAWFEAAERTEGKHPEAMTLCTCDSKARPSARTVLLKGRLGGRFVFFTNGHSRKGQELARNQHVALLFYWKSQDRQVRIEGPVSVVEEALSDEYFASRPRLNRLGAWASEQSMPLESRAVLLERLAALERRYGEAIPRPPHWQGYGVQAQSFQFWEQGDGRLHHCERFESTGEGWRWTLLNP